MHIKDGACEHIFRNGEEEARGLRVAGAGEHAEYAEVDFEGCDAACDGRGGAARAAHARVVGAGRV